MFSFLSPASKKSLPKLRFHNTLSGKLEEFTPLQKGKVRMYNCGPTPYDEQHIGNMLPPVLGNLLHRTLVAWGYSLKQVMNITDFGHLSGDNAGDADTGEDRMSKGLRQRGMALTMENMRVLAEENTGIFLRDVAQLGVDNSKVLYPRASAYIREQIALIQTLEQKGYAYVIDDGVYFDTAKFSSYGKLGGINLRQLQEGARVAVNTQKRNPADFALWKSDKKLGWDSPWGKGFPGWHIECTAMIFTLLGRQIDIHTGGIEHIPVHHNNEIAQAEAATGKQYVRYWLHNAHITIEGKKISKSLGNTVYLHNILDRGFSPRALRYWYMSGHYRTPMNFTWDALEGANTGLMRLQRYYFEDLGGANFISLLSRTTAPDKKFTKDFYNAIAHDLDTARALARAWELVKDTNISPAAKRSSLLLADEILGLGLSEPRVATKLSVVYKSDLPEEVQKLVNEREVARANKDFARADDLRAQIEQAGYTIQDKPEGPEIIKARP